MKREQIKISIDNPCAENFKDFESTVNGGICKNCMKEVIDFTHYSDRELFDFFKLNTTGICGQFRPDQLKTLANNQQPHKSRIPYLAATFGAILILYNDEGLIAQPQKETSQEIIKSKRELLPLSEPSTAEQIIVIGRVFDENDSSAIQGATIIIKGTTEGTITNEDGEFELTIENPADAIVLIFSFVGYEYKEFSLNPNKQKVELGSVYLKSDDVLLGEVCVIRRSPRAFFHRIIHAFQK